MQSSFLVGAWAYLECSAHAGPGKGGGGSLGDILHNEVAQWLG